MRLGELSDDICNRLEPKFTMKASITVMVGANFLLSPKGYKTKNSSPDPPIEESNYSQPHFLTAFALRGPNPLSPTEHIQAHVISKELNVCGIYI
jgi:hypothetical protein